MPTPEYESTLAVLGKTPVTMPQVQAALARGGPVPWGLVLMVRWSREHGEESRYREQAEAFEKVAREARTDDERGRAQRAGLHTGLQAGIADGIPLTFFCVEGTDLYGWLFGSSDALARARSALGPGGGGPNMVRRAAAVGSQVTRALVGSSRQGAGFLKQAVAATEVAVRLEYGPAGLPTTRADHVWPRVFVPEQVRCLGVKSKQAFQA